MARQRVDFTELNNPMAKFLLDDGTELHVKIVLMGVSRTDEKLPDGQNRHEFNVQIVTQQLAPEGPFDMSKMMKGDSK